MSNIIKWIHVYIIIELFIDTQSATKNSSLRSNKYYSFTLTIVEGQLRLKLNLKNRLWKNNKRIKDG